MEDFRIESHLKNIYATFPEANHQPVIGITANYADGTPGSATVITSRS